MFIQSFCTFVCSVSWNVEQQNHWVSGHLECQRITRELTVLLFIMCLRFLSAGIFLLYDSFDVYYTGAVF